MRKLFSLVFFIGLVLVAFAHEYVLLAEKYRVSRGDTLELHLFVADGFNIQLERPFQHSITKSFELITGGKTMDLSNTAEGTMPVLKWAVDFDGGGLIHLRRDYAQISLPTKKFFEYLNEDHIDGIAQRVDRSKIEQTERYTRYIKCLVQSGTQYSDSVYRRQLGDRFEIVLLDNPYRLNAGATLRAQLFFEGKPLLNKLITARNRTGREPAIAQVVRTDGRGICSVRLTRKGEWFIHATHMIPSGDAPTHDWESFWASYSFEVEK